ncbi:MAG TPA: ribonuclease R [Edaphocola sp.]|nr:ribonuclease R [Edaphocola sp.]
MSRKKSKYIPQKKKKAVLKKHPVIGKRFTGKLEVTRHGKGYVVVEGLDDDIIVYPENMHVAMDGDRVKVVVSKMSKNGRLEGEVVEVITHARTEFIGRLDVSPKFAFLIPDKENIKTDIFVPLNALNGAKNGERVIVAITEWQGKTKNPAGKVTEILSGERENEIAMKEILTANGFSPNFPKEVVAEAEKLSDDFSPAEIRKRKDMRGITTFTIDPKDARDFDDALSVRPLENGDIEVGVHIADVSHFVRPGTALDAEAYDRATSVYLPDRVCPMLPEHISNFLCSLRPNEDKLAFSVIFQINRKGTIRQFWIGRTIICSDKRFTYEDAQQIIETGQGEWSEEILLLHEIAQNLRKKRFAKGAINFSSEEVRFELDENGVPVGLFIKESKEANQLIEEFMLLANKTVAAYAGGKKVNHNPIPFPYRVHDIPNEEKLGTFAAFASRFGYELNLNNPDTVARSFNAMLQQLKGRPESLVLEQLGIRTMAKAVYSTDNIGHYGLGFKDYCHFTSPIRRYPDVMVHRIVQEILDKEVKADAHMEAKCQHCSDQERKAMESEREANKYKQVEYMQKYIGETLDAVISGVSSIGFWAETIGQKCEGMVSVADLAAWDTFEYIEANYSLRGLHTGRQFQMGDKVKVLVVATHLEKRQIDFDWVPGDEPKKVSKKTAGKDKKKARK